MPQPAEIHNLAVFCDFENVALGARDARIDKFDMRRVLERLLLKGSIVVKKAYCDWDRYKEFKRDMHEAAFELIEIPHVRQSGKNSADIRLVVDALDLCYTKLHVDAFVIVSGDSDFSPLVSKLRENDKVVIGVGVRASTSDLLKNVCDEFIFYDDLVQDDAAKQRSRARRSAVGGPVTHPPADEAESAEVGAKAARKRRSSKKKAEPEAPITTAEPEVDHGDDRKSRAIEMVVTTAEQLWAERGGEGAIPASQIKNTLKRFRPDFNESAYGYKAFGKILEDAEARGLVSIERRERGGLYITLPGGEG